MIMIGFEQKIVFFEKFGLESVPTLPPPGGGFAGPTYGHEPKGGGGSWHGHDFFKIFPKQPKERFSNIIFIFWIAEVRFFDLKL